MNVRAKFKILSVTLSGYTLYDKDGKPDPREIGTVRMSAVTDDGTPENDRYHRYTPSGTVEVAIDNPPVFQLFRERLGKCVYVDFTDADGGTAP